MKQLLLLLAVVLIPVSGQSQTKNNEPGYLVLPIAARPAGIGEFYGLGIDLENIASSSIDLIGGKTGGRLAGSGALLRELTLFGDSLSLSAAYLQVDQLYFDVSYTRGMAEDNPVTQAGSGTGGFFNIHWKGLEPGVSFNTTYATWAYVFDEYLTYEDEDSIETPELHLGDLKLTFFNQRSRIQPGQRSSKTDKRISRGILIAGKLW